MILEVDDDRGFREMLRDLLVEDGIEVVGEASDGGEAARVASEVVPDVILMDLRMPNVDGIEGTRLLKTILPWCRSSFCRPTAPRPAARSAGSRGVLLSHKGCPPGMIREMLRFAWEYKLGLERAAVPHPSVDMWSQDDLDASFGPNPGWGSEQPPRTDLT